MSPFIFALQYLLIKFTHRHSPHLPTPTAFFLVTSTPPTCPFLVTATHLSRYLCFTMNVMRPAQVWCPACERVFTPHSLSQHLSRNEDPRCRSVLERSQTQSASATFPCMASHPTFSVSQISGEVALGDFNEPTQGEFAVTHVAAHIPCWNRRFLLIRLGRINRSVEAPKDFCDR